MPVEALAQVVRDLPSSTDAALLRGTEHFSDAGVYRLAPNLAIVQSVDFFPPVVNDPYVYGQIAAANSLSDVFAMGAAPRTAMNVVSFPDTELDMSVLGLILEGGAERVTLAGASIVGGHSVRDAGISYGLSVTGVVDPARMMGNDGAKAGDVLVLTKAVGTGYITTALKRDVCPDDVRDVAYESMRSLNLAASEIAVDLGVTGSTDITGFGLAGHAYEMAEASGVTLEIDLAAVPLLPGAAAMRDDGHKTRANASNAAHLVPYVTSEHDADALDVVFDPQTSGGLLLAVASGSVDDLMTRGRDAGLEAIAVVGEVKERGATPIVVR